MALPAGVRLSRSTPRASWPRTDAVPLVAPRLGQGKGYEARVAADGSRWCAYGNHTLDPTSKAQRCDACARFRDRLRHQPAGDAFRYLPTEIVHGITAASRACNQLLNRLNAKAHLHQDLTQTELTELLDAATTLSLIGMLAEEYLAY